MESYKLEDKTIKLIDKTIRETYGISLEEYNNLDFDEQQELVKKHHKKHNKKSKEVTRVMIGSGEHASFVEAGITPEEEMEELDYELDKMIYGKPKALLKRMKRKINKK